MPHQIQDFHQRRFKAFFLALAFSMTGFSFMAYSDSDSKLQVPTLKVESRDFRNQGKINKRFTCEGSDISPSISWKNVPSETESLVLIMDDPDAPMGTWTHWVLFNIPPAVQSLDQNLPAAETLPNGAFSGTNSWGRLGYGGPCPPSGTHRYFFKVYALETLLDFKPGATKEALEMAMERHILAYGERIGKYKKRKG